MNRKILAGFNEGKYDTIENIDIYIVIYSWYVF